MLRQAYGELHFQLEDLEAHLKILKQSVATRQRAIRSMERYLTDILVSFQSYSGSFAQAWCTRARTGRGSTNFSIYILADAGHFESYREGRRLCKGQSGIGGDQAYLFLDSSKEGAR